jgi:hypothetical protein
MSTIPVIPESPPLPVKCVATLSTVTATTAHQVMRRRTVDSQREEIGWVAEVDVPGAVPEPVDEYGKVDEEDGKEHNMKRAFVASRAAGSILLLVDGSVEELCRGCVKDVAVAGVVPELDKGSVLSTLQQGTAGEHGEGL